MLLVMEYQQQSFARFRIEQPLVHQHLDISVCSFENGLREADTRYLAVSREWSMEVTLQEQGLGSGKW